MTQDNNRWRDKYRSALNQQEQLEKALTAQQALLHRTVMALASAAEGHDKELDQRLSALRACLKTSDVGGFDRMLKSMDRIVEEADTRREKQWKDVHKYFAGIADKLQKLDHSSDAKPAIKQFKKAIPKGALLPATLKRLLEEFGNIQEQVIAADPNSGGFISKLFKSKNSADEITDTTQEQAVTDTEEQVSVAEADWEMVEEEPADQATDTLTNEPPTLIAELVDEDAPLHRERSIPEAVHDRPTHEPAFSRISSRVTIILIELLDHFPTVECVEQKATKARERINRGLNWYELAPTLEDIRDFVIQAHMGAGDDYRLYLKSVYSELSHITDALGLAIECDLQQRNAAQQLQDDVSTGMDNITHALAEHQEISQLKSAVESQVQSIQGALGQFKQATEQNSLSEQLTGLIERVKHMEQQDADIRQQLEQQKIKAITDNLTGLPNREAYSEKVHEEMLRWQRYERPLTLAVLDIDFFKKINDTYGHQTGDKVLKVVSQSVAKRLREVDFMARFGGEEFVLLLPETSVEDALSMLNRTRERLAKTPMRYKDQRITVTVSIGIAGFNEGDNAETVFARADKALYDAKEGGRNQCCVG